MKKSNKLSDRNLRRQAEAKLNEKKIAKSMKEADTNRLLHELQVHQIELEMQNEQLMQSQAEVEAGLKQYTDLYNELYDFAPVGYFTLRRDGTIQRVNLTGARLLGIQRSKLIRMRFGVFVSAEFRLTFADFLENVFKKNGKETYEVALLKDKHELFWAYLEAVIEDELREECRIVMVDITERKRVEIELRKHQEELDLINEELAQSRMQVDATLRQYTDLYDFAPVGYFTLTRDGTIRQVNLAGANLLDLNHNEASRIYLGEYVSRESRSDFDIFFEKLLSGEGKETCELAFEKKGNELLWARFEATCFEGGDVCRAMLTDITERKQAEKKLQESEMRFRNLVETTSDWIWEIDANGVYTYASPRIRDILGFEPSEIIGKKPVDFMPPDEAQRVLDMFIPIFAARNQFSNFENKNLHKDGHVVILETSGVPIMDNNGVFCGYRGIDRDITERKQAEQTLEEMNLELQAALTRQQQLAHTDALTGINNRRYLYELAEREFEIAARYRQPFSVIMFDIDHFKEVNDTFGHAAGDQMLQRVTQVACAELRSADVIGRYGGEEFVIALPMTNAQQAYPLAERIRKGVAAIRVQTEKGDASVTLSIGIVEKPKDAQSGSVEELIRNADMAMYTAKQAGRNRTEIGN